MITITKSIEQSLWLKWYEKYLQEASEKNLSAKGAADKADEVLKEFQDRNKITEDDFD